MACRRGFVSTAPHIRRTFDVSSDISLVIMEAYVGIAPWALDYAGPLYGAVSAVTGIGMLVLAAQVFRERRPVERACRHLFAFSILYLFLLFAVLMIDRGWGGLIARFTA